jgi:SHAQKYF class myb-like DNA-binding protein
MTDLYCDENISDMHGGSPSQREVKPRKAKSGRPTLAAQKSKRYWSVEEHALFLKALKVSPRTSAYANFISQFIKTKTKRQVRSHMQKYLIKLEKEAELETPIESLSSESDVIELNDYIEQRQPTIGYWGQEQFWESASPSDVWMDTPIFTQS